MSTTAARPTTGEAAPLMAGDLWACVTAKGRGQPVKIKRLSDNHVYFRAFGRGADESQTFKLPQAAFRIRYAPLSLAEQRRKQMQRDELSGVRPVLVEPTPVEETGEAVAVEIAPVGTQATTPALVPPPNAHKAKLTGEQAREVYQLARAASYEDRIGIAKAYGVSFAVVYSILKGKAYDWATGDLRESMPPTVEARVRQPSATQEEKPVQIKQAPITVETTEQPWRETLTKMREAAREPMPERQLLTDLADALDFLLEYAGHPLPRYMMLDLGSLQKLSERARELGDQ